MCVADHCTEGIQPPHRVRLILRGYQPQQDGNHRWLCLHEVTLEGGVVGGSGANYSCCTPLQRRRPAKQLHERLYPSQGLHVIGIVDGLHKNLKALERALDELHLALLGAELLRAALNICGDALDGFLHQLDFCGLLFEGINGLFDLRPACCKLLELLDCHLLAATASSSSGKTAELCGIAVRDGPMQKVLHLLLIWHLISRLQLLCDQAYACLVAACCCA
mmetsp:Transcript_11003/g.31075  ORF Transcript_11003/g.31075 Transcript_11003/m.31075 type:complete len:221 (-) Transcript_11003:214-876(-)